MHVCMKSELKMVPDKFTIYSCLVICLYFCLFLLVSLIGTNWLGAASHRLAGHVTVLTNALVFCGIIEFLQALCCGCLTHNLLTMLCFPLSSTSSMTLK